MSFWGGMEALGETVVSGVGAVPLYGAAAHAADGVIRGAVGGVNDLMGNDEAAAEQYGIAGLHFMEAGTGILADVAAPVTGGVSVGVDAAANGAQAGANAVQTVRRFAGASNHEAPTTDEMILHGVGPSGGGH